MADTPQVAGWPRRLTVMNFAVAVWAECQGVFGRVFAPIGQRRAVVDFKEWCSIRPPQKRGGFLAPFANAVGTRQNRHNDICIPAVANRNYLNSLGHPRGSGQPPLKSIGVEVSRTLNLLGEFTAARLFRLHRGKLNDSQVRRFINLAPSSGSCSCLQGQAIALLGQYIRQGAI